jgi:uncharacterized protein YqeY
MLSLTQIETDLKDSMKARDSIAIDTLRGLKTRIQNEQAAASSRPEPSEGSLKSGRELSEKEIIALVRSEVKRRKEAAVSFGDGSNQEMVEKELAEAKILEKYLPTQMDEQALTELIEKTITENNFVAKDFGAAMGKVKAQVGDKADGATLAKILKEKLK